MSLLRRVCVLVLVGAAMASCGREGPSAVDTAADSTTTSSMPDEADLCNKQTQYELPPVGDESPGHPSDEAAIAEAQRSAQGSHDGQFGYYSRLERSTISDDRAVWQTREGDMVVAEVGVSKSDYGWWVTDEFYLLPPEVCRKAHERRQQRLRQPPDSPTTTTAAAM